MTRPRAEPHRVDVRRPRPGRVSRGTPPEPPAPPPPNPPKRRGCGKPVLALVAVVLGLPMILAGMWSYQPDLGRPLTLAALPVAFLAASLFRPRRRLPAGDYISGNTYVMGTQMDPDFIPPSTSLNPAATVAPDPRSASPIRRSRSTVAGRDTTTPTPVGVAGSGVAALVDAQLEMRAEGTADVPGFPPAGASATT